MQKKVQKFYFDGVEVQIYERLVGEFSVGYEATFHIGKQFYRVYGATSTACWVFACQEIREKK